MLKIKDEVDLKELEKFGFEYQKDTDEWCECYRNEYEDEKNINTYLYQLLINKYMGIIKIYYTI